MEQEESDETDKEHNEACKRACNERGLRRGMCWTGEGDARGRSGRHLGWQ